MDERDVLSKDINKYNVDWMNKYHGESNLVLLPNSTEKISRILQYCNSQNIAVVPQSGNTGLVGGSVPYYDELILSMERMNQIIEFDETNDIITTEAGVVLEVMNQYLS